MLTNADRFATPAARRLRIGDRIRFPLRLGQYTVYPRDWEIISFGGAGLRHCCTVRRLHDGITRTISQLWAAFYIDL